MARWALIAGPKKSDRSGQALALSRTLKSAGYTIGGFVQLKRHDEKGRKVYDLLRLTTDERIQVGQQMIVPADDGSVTTCSVQFDSAVFEIGEKWLRQDSVEADCVFIGEISKVEVSGEGHSPSVQCALSLPESKFVVLVVRSDQLFDVVERFGLQDDFVAALELPASDDVCDQFRRDVRAAMSSMAHHTKASTHGP